MRELSRQELRDISRGSAVLASGGGGDPYLGTLAALNAHDEFGPPTLIDPSEVPEAEMVACPAVAGAPMPFIEKLTLGPELDTAYEALSRRLDKPLHALMPVEAGGVNMMIPFLMGGRHGLPVVDADCMGRAFPESPLVTLTLFDINMCPIAIADEHGNAVVVEAIDNHWADPLCRATYVEFGATAGCCEAALTGAQLRQAAVQGSVSQAERIGAAIRSAGERKEDPVAGLIEATGGYELFRGKIVDVERRTERGWTFGSVVVEGFDRTAASQLTIQFRNENLLAELDTGEVLASVPDIITVIDAETGQAITTERLRYGFRVIVFAMPVDEKWRTPRGVELGGPRHFDIDLDFVPVEELAAKRAERGSASQPAPEAI